MLNDHTSRAAFAIIKDDLGRVLMCLRTDMDLWNLPGGRVEAGENPVQAAIREVREEVGLEVVIEKLTGVYYEPTKDVLVYQFICRKVGGRTRLTGEAMDIRYFFVEDLPLNVSPRVAERLHHAIDTTDLEIITQYSLGGRDYLDSLTRAA